MATLTKLGQDGVTTVDLNLRAGPGTQFAVQTVLPPQTPVVTLAEQGDWLQVTALGQTGWVHRSFVKLETQGTDPGLLRPRPDSGAPAQPPGPLAPPDAQAIRLPANAGPGDRQAANIWNKYGGLLAE